MSGIFGVLGVNDTDREFLNTIGQQVVYTAIQQLLEQHNADLNAATTAFIEGVTEDHKYRYKLPGGGRLQRLGGQSQAGAVKATGQWDVAFPLEDFGAQVAGNRIDMAYMTVQDLDRHLDTVFAQDINTMRYEILKAVLNNAQDSFVDERKGTLAIEPLANGDSVLYPPVLGSESEATDDHYLESGYAASGISDSNNPFITIRDELEEHFGAPQGGSNIAVLINQAQVTKTEALTDYDAVDDRFTTPGDNTDRLSGMPAVPGRVIGRTNGVWVVEWRWIPANYMLGLHLDAPRPLMVRVHPANTGLPRGLQLVAEDDVYPLQASHYEHSFGIGCGNRLNGVVMELGTGGTYSVPSGY